jgi:hypothetical protein
MQASPVPAASSGRELGREVGSKREFTADLLAGSGVGRSAVRVVATLANLGLEQQPTIGSPCRA